MRGGPKHGRGFRRLLLISLVCAAARAQTPETNLARPDYSRAARAWPWIWKPYLTRHIPEALLTNAEPLQVRDGRLELSIEQVLDLVLANNLSIAAARLYPSMAQADLLRAKSGSSPRGVDQAVVPSIVFAGAVGGSILGGGGNVGGTSFTAGGITGNASAVTIRPAGLFDPTVSVNFSVDHTSSPLNTVVVSGVPAVTTTTRAFSFGYTQAFSTGLSISASYGVNRQKSTQLHLLYNPYYTPGFNVSFAQQLLNGFGKAVNLALIHVAQNEQNIERESFRATAVTAIVAAENAYWDLIAAKEAVSAAEEEVKAAEQLVENNRKEFEAGVMSRLDIATAESQAATSRRDLIVARTNEQNAELQLKTLISKNLDEPLASASIQTVDAFPEPDERPLPKLEEAVAIARKNRPEVSIAEGNIKSQRDVQPFVRNSLLPSMNIFGLMTTDALSNEFGTAWVEAVQFKYPLYAFGINISFPVRNRQAQADNIRAQLELRQSEDTLLRTRNQIELDVQNGLTASRQARQQVISAREALRLAETQLDAEQKRLAAGVSNAYNVVLRQRDVFTARLALAQAQDAYAKARVTLDQAMGTTFEANHLNFEQALARR
ncbi:MAG TPA: TolC family protein [Bryobacteraceae bacterium]|jgi:outer membrane protein TolC|nr:TolC family protein [Bryobacteraceae bacterium]